MTHPLDPFSADEFSTVAGILRREQGVAPAGVVRATGMMVTHRWTRAPNPNGTLVDERTYAPLHQHFLVARLDLDVEGNENTAYMTESYAEPICQENPTVIRWWSANVALRTEAEGRQDMKFATQRAWKR